MTTDGRSLPQNLEAERAILGLLILDGTPARVLEAAELVEPADYYREAHARLMALLLDMAAKNQPVELVAVAERIHASGRAGDYGGLEYVSALSDSVPSRENLGYYAGQVRDAAIRRRIIVQSLATAERAYQPHLETSDLLDEAETSLRDLADGQATDEGPQPLRYLLGEAGRELEAATNGQRAAHVSTGYPTLDRMLVGGLAPGRLLVIAGRPGMGKSSLALDLAANVAATGRAALVCSLEMARLEVTQRLWSGRSGVALPKLLEGTRLSPRERHALAAAQRRLAGWPLSIDDTPGIKLAQIEARVQRLKAARPDLAVVVVDYVGLMGDALRGGQINREQQVAANSRGLKALAKKYKVCVILLAQLNRLAEGRKDRRPMLSELRESGSLEQDADTVMLCYRDGYYHRASPYRGVAEVIIAKQRSGPTGTARLYFDGVRTRFLSLETAP